MLDALSVPPWKAYIVTSVLAAIGDIERVMLRLSSVAWNPTRLEPPVSVSPELSLPLLPEEPFEDSTLSMMIEVFEQPQRTNAYAANILILSLHMKEVRYATSQYYDGDLPSYQVQNQEDMTAAHSGTKQINSTGGTDTASGSALADWAGVEDTRKTIPPQASSSTAVQGSTKNGGYEWDEKRLKELADGWKSNPDYDKTQISDRYLELNSVQVLDVETLEVIDIEPASKEE